MLNNNALSMYNLAITIKVIEIIAFISLKRRSKVNTVVKNFQSLVEFIILKCEEQIIFI